MIMEEKSIVLKVNEGNYIRSYLQLFVHVLKLTDKELQVLEYIVMMYYEANYNFLSSQNRIFLTQKMGFKSVMNLNNYIKSLKDKKVIIKKEGIYIVNPLLIPPKRDALVKIFYKW